MDWDRDLALNQNRGLDIMDLNLVLDDGGIVGNRCLEDSWDSNREMRSGVFQDPGVVARDIAGLSKVDLLGDNGGRLVDSGGNITSNKSMASRGRSKALDRL